MYCAGRPPIWENEGELAAGIYVDGEEWKPEWEDLYMTPPPPTDTGSDRLSSALSKTTENILDFTNTVAEYAQETVTTILEPVTTQNDLTTQETADQSSPIVQEILRSTTPILDKFNDTVANYTRFAANMTHGMNATGLKDAIKDFANTKIQEFAGKYLSSVVRIRYFYTENIYGQEMVGMASL